MYTILSQMTSRRNINHQQRSIHCTSIHITSEFSIFNW